MQESKKTVCFVATACVLGLAALVNGYVNQPGRSSAESVVGEAFYPDFTSTEAARSLEVSAVDPETGSLKRFAVKNDGNLWRIPTHYDYPAEAAARIAETSASVMGLEKEAIVGMGESEFEKFGVVDPLSDDLEDPETAGKRITLNDENGDTLVDYIIGKEIEDAVPTRDGNEFDLESEAKEYYIRKADGSQTFRVSLDIDLSTKFEDWIDPDLLRINRPDVTEISINNYKLDERGSGAFGMTQLVKVPGDELALSRSSPSEPWTLEGLAEAEEVVADRMNEILGVLDEIQMVGVRPKFKFEGKQLLNPDLTLFELPEVKTDPEKANRAYTAMQEDLAEKGFNLAGTQAELQLVSENGELEFGTSKGLRYRLHVGGAASADDESIEIGSADKPDEEAEEKEASSEDDDSNRFLYVRVTFDESLLGDRPTEPKLPEEPKKPEGYVAAAPAEEKESDESESDKEADAASETTDAAAETTKEERKPEFVAYDEAMTAYETAKGEYEMNLTRFKQDNEAYDKKIEDGKKLVDELNQRFGDWFYVISASNLNTIQSKRTDIVKLKEGPPPGQPATPPSPDISFPEIGGGTPPAFKAAEPGESSAPSAQESEMKPEDNEPQAGETGETPEAETEGNNPEAESSTNESPEKPAEAKPVDSKPAEPEAGKPGDSSESGETTTTSDAAENAGDATPANEKASGSDASDGGQG